MGSAEIGSCVGLIIGETDGRPVVGVRVGRPVIGGRLGDNDGQNVVGLELLNAGALVDGDGSAIVIEKTGVGSGVTADDEGAVVGSSENTGVGSYVTTDDAGAVVGFRVLWSCGSSSGSGVLSVSGSVTVLSVSVLVKFCVAIFAYCSQ